MLAGRLSAAIKRRPVLSAGAALGARFFVGDLIAQRMHESKVHGSKHSIDVRRLGTFTLYGVLMGAGPMYSFFGRFMPFITSHFQSTAARCVCFVALDVGVFMPAVCFPCYYALREAVNRPDDVAAAVADSLVLYRENLWEDFVGSLAVFVPQDVLVQTCIPPHMRVPFLSVTGLMWVVMFSSSRGEASLDNETQDVQRVDQ